MGGEKSEGVCVRVVADVPEVEGHKGADLKLSLCNLFLQPQNAPASLIALVLRYFEFPLERSLIVGLIFLPGEDLRAALLHKYMIAK